MQDCASSPAARGVAHGAGCSVLVSHTRLLQLLDQRNYVFVFKAIDAIQKKAPRIIMILNDVVPRPDMERPLRRGTGYMYMQRVHERVVHSSRAKHEAHRVARLLRHEAQPHRGLAVAAESQKPAIGKLLQTTGTLCCLFP